MQLLILTLHCSAHTPNLCLLADGLQWSDWQSVFSDNRSQVVYPTLMALEGDDNEVLGKTFAVVFEYRGGNSSGAPFQFNYVNVTVTSNDATASSDGSDGSSNEAFSVGSDGPLDPSACFGHQSESRPMQC